MKKCFLLSSKYSLLSIIAGSPNSEASTKTAFVKSSPVE